MRFANLRGLAMLLCVIMLLGMVACGTGNDIPQDTDPTQADTDAPSTDTTGETTTEAETEVPMPEISVEVNGESATVTSTEGLVYTATGFASVDGNNLVFDKELTLSFAPEQLPAEFNRMSMTYRASAPMHVYVTYLNSRDSAVTVDFYLEQGEGVFSGLIDGYIKGKSGNTLSEIRVTPCKGEQASFALYRVATETIPLYVDTKESATYYIDNGRFKLGVDMGWGGTINYLEDMTHKEKGLTNLVNKYDTGRLIQQSYYGTGAIEGVFEWGSFMESEKWPYNPVQGGDKGNVASRLIDVQVGENYVYIKSQPMDWGKVGYVTPSYMENKYVLEEDFVRVDNRFVDFSGWEHPYTGQELPALYTVSYLDTFIWYNGTNPWTGEAVSSRDDLQFWGDAKYVGDCTFKLRQSNTETWCAWVNTDVDFGIGLYVPNVDLLKAGRYQYNKSKDADDNATNYVAPYNSMQMVAYEAMEYSYLLTTGSAEQIRATFTAHKDFTTNESLHDHYVSTRLPDVSVDMSSIDFTKQGSELTLSDAHNAKAAYDADAQAVLLSMLGDDPYIFLDFAMADKVHYAEDYSAIEIEYMIPTTNSAGAYTTQLFTCTGEQSSPTGTMVLTGTLKADGQYHTLKIDLAGCAFWQGKIHQLRLDFFAAGAAGDVMYIKSFKLVEGNGNGLPSIDLNGEPKLSFADPAYSAFLSNPNGTFIEHSDEQQAVALRVGDPADVSVVLSFASLGVQISANTYKTLVIEYVLPTTNSKTAYQADLFLCAGNVTAPTGEARVRVTGLIADGEVHTVEVDLSGYSFWKGNINMIRIDYFDQCAAGDVFYLRSIALEE